MLAAVLACGKGAVVSHGSAAFLLGLWESEPRAIHVIAANELGRKIPGIHRHHVPPPLGKEVVVHEAIPCASPSRIIVDLAGTVGDASLRRTIEQAAVLQMLDVAEIDAILSGSRRRGSRRLRGILEDWRRYSRVRLRSRMEAKLLPLLSQRDLPIPSCNELLRIDGQSFEIDFSGVGIAWSSKPMGEGFMTIPLPRPVTSTGTEFLLPGDFESFACGGRICGIGRRPRSRRSSAFSTHPAPLFLSRLWLWKGTAERSRAAPLCAGADI